MAEVTREVDKRVIGRRIGANFLDAKDSLWIQETYFDSRRRYTSYYLRAPRLPNELVVELAEDLVNLKRAFHWACEAADYVRVAEFWGVASAILWDHGYWQVYLEWGERTLEALHHLGLRMREAWLLGALGWLRLERGEFALAGMFFDRAEGLFADFHHARGIAVIQRYRGVLAHRTGKFDEANDYYETALDYFDRVSIATTVEQSAEVASDADHEDDHVLSVSEIRNLQGSLAKGVGDYDAARRFYHESSRLLESKNSLWRLTAVRRNLARLDLQLGDLVAAKEGFEQTIQLCVEVDRKDMLYGCQLWLAEIESRLGNEHIARELLRSAMDGFRELGMLRDLNAAEQLLVQLQLRD